MDSNILKSKCGGSLLEVAVGIAIVSFAILAVTSTAQGLIMQSKAAKTLENMNAIITACRQYYSQNGSWPNVLADLQPELINPLVSVNDFGQAYEISSVGSHVSVISRIPADIVVSANISPQAVIINEGTWDQIKITHNQPVGKIGWLKYDKVNLHNE